MTVEQAMAPGATPLHPDLRKDNVIVHSHLTMGPKDFTFEEGLQEANEKYGEENLVVLDKVYHTCLLYTSSPIAAYGAMLEGCFGNLNSVAEVLLKMIPLLLAALGLTISSRA